VDESDGSRPPGPADDPDSYVERIPTPALAGRVRTVWVQQTGVRPYVQRNLPTGGVELHCPLGGVPTVIGPLTTAKVTLLPSFSTVVGVRFWPGSAAPLFGVPFDELVDRTVPLDDLWRHSSAMRLGELLAAEPGPQSALATVQRVLIDRQTRAADPDPVVSAAVCRMMPWQPVEIRDLSSELMISSSQLRRRFLPAVGLGPKALQRTLRFQGYLALAQAAAATSARRPRAGVADLAADVGYADHAHLSRECRRISGLTPHELLGGGSDTCRCAHDHAASYNSFLGASRRHAPVG